MKQQKRAPRRSAPLTMEPTVSYRTLGIITMVVGIFMVPATFLGALISGLGGNAVGSMALVVLHYLALGMIITGIIVAIVSGKRTLGNKAGSNKGKRVGLQRPANLRPLILLLAAIVAVMALYFLPK